MTQSCTPGPDEYLDPSDGRIHCARCGGARQAAVPRGDGGMLYPRCLCPCQSAALAQQEEQQRQRRTLERIRRRRAQGLQDKSLYRFTFANDNGRNPLMAKARAYVEHWDRARAANAGLLLFGDVGTGKSFFAGCVANALLDRDIPVLMASLPGLLNRMAGLHPEERGAFVDSLGDYELLVLDDLGAERESSFAQEQVFWVVDSRCRSARPMIITTNLTLDELRHPPDLARRRIYERVLECCAPIRFDGPNLRADNARENRERARALVAGGGEGRGKPP